MPNWVKYIVVSCIVIILGCLYWIFDIEPARKRAANINKAIYTTFRSIENHCLEYVNRRVVDRKELDKCEQVVKYNKACINDPNGCWAEDYYKELEYIGFSLPPLYNPTPSINK